MEPASASASASVPERPPPRRSNCGAGVSPAHLGGSSWKPAAVSLRSASSAASRVPSESELSSVPRVGTLTRLRRAGGLLSWDHLTLANLRQLKTQNSKLKIEN